MIAMGKEAAPLFTVGVETYLPPEARASFPITMGETRLADSASIYWVVGVETGVGEGVGVGVGEGVGVGVGVGVGDTAALTVTVAWACAGRALLRSAMTFVV